MADQMGEMANTGNPMTAAIAGVVAFLSPVLCCAPQCIFGMVAGSIGAALAGAMGNPGYLVSGFCTNCTGTTFTLLGLGVGALAIWMGMKHLGAEGNAKIMGIVGIVGGAIGGLVNLLSACGACWGWVGFLMSIPLYLS